MNNSDWIEKAILRSMNEGVITLECNGNIFTINPAALQILGLQLQDVQGKHFRAALSNHPENMPFLSILEDAVTHARTRPREEVTFQRDDGQTVDLTVSVASLDIDVCGPEIQNVVVVFRDITAFKFLQRARMRAVNHLSHEIATPLSIIDASAELLLKQGTLEDSSRSKLMRIKRNVARLLDLRSIVEEILDPPPYEPKTFSVKECLDSQIQEIKINAGQREIGIALQSDKISVDFVDPHVLSVAVRTFLKNAIENTPDEGHVSVAVSYAHPRLTLEVQDRGIGIPLTDQAFIFDAFYNTQPTEDYASKSPFQFNAGGKGLELFRLKVLSETAPFDVYFTSQRCRYIPLSTDLCPGRISLCPHISGVQDCRNSGGSVFGIAFSNAK
ncbi:MAG: domain S-box protein [Thermodesulfobacteriota bacterium]|nr:domain S-box protein [Thermodesulfobacteriota bacterium]